MSAARWWPLPLLLALLLLSPHSAAAQRVACGGHFVNYVGGLPRMGLTADALSALEPAIPEPPDWTPRDREVWDALVFNAFDHWEHASQQVTVTITPDRLASINICQQGPDVSHVGKLMEPYGRAWWREWFRYWSGHSWAGEFVVGDCSGEPEVGWIHVRAGESRGTAHANTWRDYSSGVPKWEKAEIVTWSDWGRNLPEAQAQEIMEEVLAHELGHVMGFWHVPNWTGFMMGYGLPAPTTKERDMAHLAYRVGPGVQYPGLVRPDDLPPPDDVEVAERAALTVLYDATDGPNWKRKRSWLTDAPLSSWQSVITNEAGRVTGVRLPNNNLTGRLPAELGELRNLEDLILSSNNLSGPIRPELSNLKKLWNLYLEDNNLTGSIPPELADASTLQTLKLNDNNLTGRIPPELADAPNLHNLYLHGNELSGRVPPELGRSANLGGLYINDNRLSGPLPSSLTDLRLYWLHIENNAGLCAPADEEFQAWLATLWEFRGETCGQMVPALPHVGALLLAGLLLMVGIIVRRRRVQIL